MGWREYEAGAGWRIVDEVGGARGAEEERGVE